MSDEPAAAEIRFYPAVPESEHGRKRRREPPPPSLIGRLARFGIRLTDEGVRLRAEVPRTSLRDSHWPLLNRALAHHAPFLADQARVIEQVRERFEPEDLRIALQAFGPPLVDLAHETVGGVKRWNRLLAGPLTGADLDLACAAYANLSSVQAILDGDANVVDQIHKKEEPV